MILDPQDAINPGCLWNLGQIKTEINFPWQDLKKRLPLAGFGSRTSCHYQGQKKIIKKSLL
jgi:hypothetical protein